MGTTVRVVLYSREEPAARGAADAALARIAELDRTLSDYRAESELSRVTRGRVGQPIPVGRDMLAVLQSAQDLAVRSGGAFDITVGPLSKLWRRARRQVELPAAEELAAARALTGYRLLSVDARARTVTVAKAGMALDPGGIAKGYAADAALEVLRQSGHARALVAVGGDVAAGDAPPDKGGWEVAIAGLDPGGVAPSSPLTVANAGVSTSGDAEQWVEIDGRRYSHIVNPLTGLGITGRRTVTVVARDAMTSDMLATALSVMDLAPGLALADSTPGAAAQVGVAGDSGVSWRRSRAWTKRRN
jgi:thiamine biosynthesis lipoprotein